MTENTTPEAAPTEAPGTPAVPTNPSPDPTAPAGGWRETLEHDEEILRKDLGSIEHKIGEAFHHDHGAQAPSSTLEEPKV